MTHWLNVALPLPVHTNVARPLTYRARQPLPAGTLVRVPLGQRTVLGIVWEVGIQPPDAALAPRIREVDDVLEALPPLTAQWRALMAFVSGYYQHALGEVALAALPPQLRSLNRDQLDRRLRGKWLAALSESAFAGVVETPPALTTQQARVLQQMQAQPGPFLLHGVTGSGKTEVYLRAAQRVLQDRPQGQVLVLVPEINLTPQLQRRFAQRFGEDAVAALHSGLTPAQRLRAWLAAHLGRARVVLGTRVAVLASMPQLVLIVVDEEHDASFKQQEGARYSARDVALYRGHLAQVPVLLGSATPSLESWHASTPVAEGGRGRYVRLALPCRVAAGGVAPELPRIRRVDMRRQPPGTVLAPPLLAAIGERVARGEQALLLLNRRGYAPLLQCPACGWKSECPHCSAYRVFHKADRSLRCHHCGLAERVPRACPDCGNLDLGMLGRGTEQLEEQLRQALAQASRPDGSAVRILRIDADSTRGRGQLEAQLAQVHGGDADVLVGTQMIAKGHDFRRVTLVAAVNPDNGLYSSDFRAPERLFALLMQAAGRAGRSGLDSEVWLQTSQPGHPLYAALKRHDFAGFAATQLEHRAQAGLPPFSHLALLRADARTQQVAQDYLAAFAARTRELLAPDPALAQAVMIYPPVPLAMQRVASVERAQLLLESRHRQALQRVLARCVPLLRALRNTPAHRRVLRWVIDVDPLTF
ncbi:MAG: primosomal protein N' [Ottowia sp.]|nr:primosomal protein N' [Ottowia sp.]